MAYAVRVSNVFTVFDGADAGGQAKSKKKKKKPTGGGADQTAAENQGSGEVLSGGRAHRGSELAPDCGLTGCADVRRSRRCAR
jgi:hypothetical protein